MKCNASSETYSGNSLNVCSCEYVKNDAGPSVLFHRLALSGRVTCQCVVKDLNLLNAGGVTVHAASRKHFFKIIL